MSDPVQQAANTPAVAPPPVQLDGRLDTQLQELKLPVNGAETRLADSKAQIAELVGQENAARAEIAVTGLQTKYDFIQQKVNFLSRESFEDANKIINSTAEALDAAAQKKDGKAFLEQLEKLNALLGNLESFIRYEVGQGLVATHADSGVRIYLRGDKIYLCTPDKNAFKDLETSDKAKLESFVSALTGIEKVELAKLQESRTENGVELLGCRIDHLKLKTLAAGEKYSVKTTTRNGDTNTEHIIYFTREDLATGRAANLLNNNAATGIRDIKLITGDSGSPDSKSLIIRSAAYVAPVGGRIPSALPLRPRAGLPEPASDAAAARQPLRDRLSRRYSETARIAANEGVAAHQKVLTDIDPNTLDTPEKLAKAISDLEASQKKHATSFERKVLQLERDLDAAEGGSRASAKLQQELKQLKTSQAEGLLKYKELLETQLKELATADDALKLPIKAKLVECFTEIDDAYKFLKSQSAGQSAHATHEAAHSDFTKAVKGDGANVKGYEAEVATEISKGFSKRARIIFDKIYKNYKYVNGGQDLPFSKTVGSIKTTVGEWIFGTLDNKLQETVKLIEKPAADLTDTECKKCLKTLGKHSSFFEEQIKSLEKRIRAGETGLDETLKNLEDIHSKATLQRGEILKKQLAEATDPQTKLTIRKQLFGELADKIEDAYARQAKSIESKITAIEEELTGSKQPEAARKAELEAEHKKLESERAKNTADLDEYKKARATEAPEIAREERVSVVRNETAVKEAISARERIEAELKKAPDGSRLKAELDVEHKIAVTRENSAVAQAELDRLQLHESKNPNDSSIKQQIEKIQQELDDLQRTEVKQKISLAEERIKTVDVRTAEIDAKLADTANPPAADEATKLQEEKAKLTEQKASLEAEKLITEGQGQIGQMKSDIKAAKEELKLKKAELEKMGDSADAAAKKALEDDIRARERKILNQESKLMDQELEGAKKMRAHVEKTIAELDAEIAKNPPNKAELEAKRALEQEKVAATKVTEEYLTDQKKTIKLERQAANAKQHLAAAQDELIKIREAGPPTEAQSKRITDLESRIPELEKVASTTTATSTAASVEVSTKWTSRFKTSYQRWNASFENWQTNSRAGKFVNDRPVVTALGAIGIAESIHTMMAADYSDDARHTCLPSMLYLMNLKPDQWALVGGSTKELGSTRAHIYEAMSGGSNAVIVGGTLMAGFNGTHYAGSAVTTRLGQTAFGARAGQMLSYPGQRFGAAYAATLGRTSAGSYIARHATLGNALNFAGSAYTGYLATSDHNALLYDTDTQFHAKTKGTMAVNITIGAATAGPPGAAIAALGTTVGELYGCKAALDSLDAEIAEDWQKRGVRESILGAEAGYIYPENDRMVTTRRGEPLTDYEAKAIDKFADAQMLRQLFEGKDEKGNRLFSDQDLKTMGFILPSAGGDPSDIGKHNHHRLTELLGPRTFRHLYFRIPGTRSESLAFAEDHSELSAIFDAVKAKQVEHYTDLYRRSMKVSYNYSQDRSTASYWLASLPYTYGLSSKEPDFPNSTVNKNPDLPSYVRSIAEEFHQKFGALESQAFTPEQLKTLAVEERNFLTTKFPHLDHLMSRDPGRSLFFSEFGRQIEAIKAEAITAGRTAPNFREMEKCACFEQIVVTAPTALAPNGSIEFKFKAREAETVALVEQEAARAKTETDLAAEEFAKRLAAGS